MTEQQSTNTPLSASTAAEALNDAHAKDAAVPTAVTSTAPADETAPSADTSLADTLDELLRDAEQRGYLRARNELAQAAMKRPRLWENPLRTESTEPAPTTAKASDNAAEKGDLTTEFLTRLRPCVWD